MLTQAEYVSLKRRLNIQLGKLRRSVPGPPWDGNWCLPVWGEDDPRVPIYRSILEETESALAVFEERGYPDDWPLWRNAREDAARQLGHVADWPF